MAVATRGNQTAGGRFVRPTEKKAGADVASRTDTSTFTGTAFNCEDAAVLDAELVVTALSGAGTGKSITLKLQSTVDGTNWWDVGTFDAQTGTADVSRTFGPLGIQARWVGTLAAGGATPAISVTWSVDTQAVIRAV